MAIKYVDYSTLTYYDSKIKTYIGEQDAKVLEEAGVTVSELETPTAGSAATYVFKQNNAEIGKVEIPLDACVESGSIVTEDDKKTLVLILANTEDSSTTSKKKEIKIDISSLATSTGGEGTTVDLTSLNDRVGIDETLNAYQDKENLTDILNILTGDNNTTGSIAKIVKDASLGETPITATEISLVKQDDAEDGYFATYYVTQDGVQVGEKINIPKDYLVKSATLVKYIKDTETNKYYDSINDSTKTSEIETLPSGVVEDTEYIDFVINVKDGAEDVSHLYLNVNSLGKSYTGISATDGISIAVDAEIGEISASVSGKAIARENIADAFEEDIKDVEDKVTGDFKIGDTVVSIKEYIDSRIFVGTEAEVTAAKAAGAIDDTALIITVSESGSSSDESVDAISDNEVD